MSVREYNDVVMECIYTLYLPDWKDLHKIERLRLRRRSPDWARARIAALLLSGEPFQGWWPRFVPDLPF